MRVCGSCVVVAALVGATSACARPVGPYRYPTASRQIDRRVYDQGYNDGRRLGAADASRRRTFDYARHGEYRRADRYRDRESDVYRQGFIAGYEDGYGRQDRYGRQPSRVPGIFGGRPQAGRDIGGYYSPARNTGYRDGLEQGREDRRDGDRYDPIAARRYREGDHDYNSQYGSRDNYKREYRAAFVQGYEEGYRRN
jgi:hypothetical protein